MKAWQIQRIGPIRMDSPPLRPAELPIPSPRPGEVRLRVSACGVCHTELDEIEGRTAPPRLPVVPGHQIVGVVDAVGPGADRGLVGRRVGVAWIASACGRCARCREGRENLCPEFRATGRDVDGGYAAFAVARADFVYPLPDSVSDLEAAPLLCAGAIGWRSLRLAELNDGQVLGLTGFGASAHLVLRLARARWPRSPVFVFARSEREREFARSLGATWAGDTSDTPPAPPDRIIDTTPAWRPVVTALRVLAPGGRLVVNAIRKEDADRSAIAELDYPRDLWMEKQIVSVANVTRADVRNFLQIAAEIGLRPEVEVYPFADANRALLDLHQRQVRGAKVLAVAD